MRMRVSRWAIATAVILAVGCVTQAHADNDGTVYRWGVGWDDGVGIRYMTSPTWGIGLQFKPDISSYTTTTSIRASDNNYQISGEDETDRANWTVGVMVFRHAMLTKHLGIGPYGRIAYSREKVDGTTNHTGVPRYMNRRGNLYTFEFGIRPTFTFQKRFVLESRFGFGVMHRDHAQGNLPDVGVDSRHEIDETGFFALGNDLGPGAVMQFMIYF